MVGDLAVVGSVDFACSDCDIPDMEVQKVTTFEETKERILAAIPAHRSVTFEEILDFTKCAPRSVRYVIKREVKKGTLQASLDMHDLRRRKYTLASVHQGENHA